MALAAILKMDLVMVMQLYSIEQITGVEFAPPDPQVATLCLASLY